MNAMLRKTLWMGLLGAGLWSASGPGWADVAASAAEVKDATVEAAKKTGAAAKEVAHEVAGAASKAYHEGKTAAKEVVRKAAEGTERAAGKVKAAASD